MDLAQTLTSGARPIWPTGAAAALAGSVATELFGLAARAAGVPMEAGGVGADTTEPIMVGMFAMGTVICTFWGTVRRARPGRGGHHPDVRPPPPDHARQGWRDREVTGLTARRGSVGLSRRMPGRCRRLR
ncbi:DUF6069 family protein [Actinomadura coerulea]|uniref:DUF6069 family protein n=1 Tax=Actinomadura coerulea TaxID=46159 RepID=UPI00343F32CD